MKNVLIGILGIRLDHGGLGKNRWNRWRPTVSLFLHDDLRIDELILIHHCDEQHLLDLTIKDIQKISPNTSCISHQVDYADPWDFEQVYSSLYSMSRSYPPDAEENNYYIHITTGTHVAQICLYLLTEANYLPGKLLQTSPVRQQKINSPEGRYQIIDLDLSRYDQIASRFEHESHQGISYLKNGIDTRNAQFNQLISQLEQVSIRSSEPILLTGATGVGKSQLARRIYTLKKQRGQLYGGLIEVNCATLRGNHAMSALFGHSKGAFTGAVNARQGLLREADQGLLFLDEIGELGLDEQAMLLGAIEEKTFMPFGSDQETQSDFQLIAGTNCDLFKQVKKGLFREDLLARINLWHYRLPALKDRIEDLIPNIEHELEKYTRKAGYKIDFNKAAKQQYLQFAYSKQALWQANFRDLNSSITRMATLANGGRITEAVVQVEMQRLQSDWQYYQSDYADNMKSEPPEKDCLKQLLGKQTFEQLDVFEQLQLQQVVAICKKSHSLAEAGRTLFNISRTSKRVQNDSHRLRQYLKKYEIQFVDILKYFSF
jgi:transcriptional regulatory protein RtcR